MSQLSVDALLAQLWLAEPTADIVESAANRIGLPTFPAAELAEAYVSLFIMGVYPYGTVFTDPGAELNGPLAQRLAGEFRAFGYIPSLLQQVAAADHLGMCLGFGDHLGDRVAPGFWHDLMSWAPVCCWAVEVEPRAHSFYVELARVTRAHLLDRWTGECESMSLTSYRRSTWDNLDSTAPTPPFAQHLADPTSEVRLGDIVRYFLAPARCGVYLSRTRLGTMACELGLQLPFGSRHELGAALFRSAHDPETLAALLEALDGLLQVWSDAYSAWSSAFPAWQPLAGPWLARLDDAQSVLAEMQRQAVLPLS